MWKIMNSFRGKRGESTNINITPDDFNKYFANVAKLDILDKIDVQPAEPEKSLNFRSIKIWR
nr:unnamed protein product [Callosobruchus analis]